jgi:hypothetical protein
VTWSGWGWRSELARGLRPTRLPARLLARLPPLLPPRLPPHPLARLWARLRLARNLALFTVWAWTALLTAGCGATSSASPSTGTVYDRTVSARTAQVEVVLRIASARASTYIVANGQVDLEDGGCALTLFDSGTTVHELLSGADLYIKLPLRARSTNGGKPWAMVKLRSGRQEGPGVAPGSPLTEVDPAPVLALLRVRPSGVTLVQQAIVAGQSAREFALTYPAAALGRPGPNGTGPGGVLALIVHVASPKLKHFRVDVWLDREGRVVQIEASTTLDREPVAPSPAQAALANQLPTTLTVRVDLTGFGQPIDLDLPMAADVARMPLSQLQAGLL